MSEYQFYEFRAIDRPLNQEEVEAVGRLSSRVDLSPQHAKFVYNYSDLPANAEELLATYFDAMFYIANWGSCQLMFRFPKETVDLEQMRAYCQSAIVDEFLSLSVKKKHVILNVTLHSDEPPDWGWIEGDTWLPQLLPLRDDLLRGDMRLLYLAWLKATTMYAMEDELETITEPPTPPGLRQLSPPLKAFIDLFELDSYIVEAAAQASGAPVSVTPTQLKQAITQLTPEEQADWLLRLAQGEPQISTAFNQALLKRIDLPETNAAGSRTVDELLVAAEKIEQAAETKAKAAAKARHLKKMEKLATQESQLWEEIISLIEQKNSRTYDEAVSHLKDLRDLAQHQNEEAVFRARLSTIQRDYSRLSALMRRLREAGLY